MDTQQNPNIQQPQKDPNRKLKMWNIIVAIIDVILLLLLIFWPRQCGCNRVATREVRTIDTVLVRDTVLVHDTIPDEHDIDQAVDDAGGETGYMGMKLVWNEDGRYRVDFDAHAKEPGGDHIYYLRHNQNKGQSPTRMGGLIDVDMIGPIDTGVENIMWPSKERLADGVYQFSVVNYEQLNGNNGFKVKIYVGNTAYIYQQTQAVRQGATVKIADVTLQNGEIKDIKHYLQPQQGQ